MNKEIIFGPVASRRLGRSLGVNIVPEKICSLDCLYCEVCKTNALTLKRAPYIPADRILAEFRAKYPLLKDRVDVVTITGAGEPTLNSQLKEIVSGIKAVSEHPVGILTNSTMLSDSNVAEALLPLDIVVPSLDAVTQSVFEAADRPAPGLEISKIIESLVSFSHKFKGKLYLEILLVKGVNDSPGELLKFAETAKRIRHDKIQLGTVFRPPAWEGTERLPEKELEDAYLLLSKQGLNVEPVGAFSGRIAIKTMPDMKKQLVESLLRMRPSTIHDISAGMGISVEEAGNIISTIDFVQTQDYDGETYYSIR